MATDRPGETRESKLASGWTVNTAADTTTARASTRAKVSKPSRDEVADSPQERDSAHDDDASADSPALSNTAVMLLGVFGGLALLYTWGWAVVANAYTNINAATAAGSGLIGGALQQAYFWIAPAAPGLWFILTLLLNYKKATWRLGLWLLIGAVVLLPFPILIGGAS